MKIQLNPEITEFIYSKMLVRDANMSYPAPAEDMTERISCLGSVGGSCAGSCILWLKVPDASETGINVVWKVI